MFVDSLCQIGEDMDILLGKHGASTEQTSGHEVAPGHNSSQQLLEDAALMTLKVFGVPVSCQWQVWTQSLRSGLGARSDLQFRAPKYP
mmetsp:Transcript_4274/g.6946  ORF Transcript_4274/g.6946 Transcript_4274/m.6946 type:complete len:88 (-) Transcript_4274:1145-1408(-)